MRKLLLALFGREKPGGLALSNHKLLGTGLLAVAIGIVLLGGVWLDDEQIVELAKAGASIPSRWGSPPEILWWTVWAFLGVGVAKEALGRRGPPPGEAP